MEPMISHLDALVSLAKRRGFAYPTSDIYGGLGGFWDFGPLGVRLARTIKDRWWKTMVDNRDDVVGLDSSIISNSAVWEASGHVATFSDPLTECKVCHMRFRADQTDEILQHEKEHKGRGDTNVSWTEPKQFNLLFKTYVGTIEDAKNLAYLRGETCQGIFVNFPNILSTTRLRIPFGIAQIGKAFRNEVTPGKFLFRLREFEQMELEYFVHPTQAAELFETWKNARFAWHSAMGIRKDYLRLRQHEASERAHYAADSWDIEYNFPDWGWKEVEGIANRTDYDLKTHAAHSGKAMTYTDPQTNEVYIPYVIEPSLGVQRMMLALLFDAYEQDEKRTVLKFHPDVAPFAAAVFPLLANKDALIVKARGIYENLRRTYQVAWDERGNIGKRYLAQDEIGTPWTITIDFQTLDDDTVTIRSRDTTKQDRVGLGQIETYIKENNSKYVRS